MAQLNAIRWESLRRLDLRPGELYPLPPVLGLRLPTARERIRLGETRDPWWLNWWVVAGIWTAVTGLVMYEAIAEVRHQRMLRERGRK